VRPTNANEQTKYIVNISNKQAEQENGNWLESGKAVKTKRTLSNEADEATCASAVRNVAALAHARAHHDDREHGRQSVVNRHRCAEYT
jgi:hypothetical protein